MFAIFTPLYKDVKLLHSVVSTSFSSSSSNVRWIYLLHYFYVAFIVFRLCFWAQLVDHNWAITKAYTQVDFIFVLALESGATDSVLYYGCVTVWFFFLVTHFKLYLSPANNRKIWTNVNALIVANLSQVSDTLTYATGVEEKGIKLKWGKRGKSVAFVNPVKLLRAIADLWIGRIRVKKFSHVGGKFQGEFCKLTSLNRVRLVLIWLGMELYAQWLLLTSKFLK